MSYTNSTTNYNLPQWISTDKPAWMADVNVAFSGIDTAMKNNSDAAAAAQSTADKTELNMAPGYSNASTYAVGDIVTYQDRLYQCDIAVTVAEDWDGTKWSLYRVSDLKDAVESLSDDMGSTDISGIGDGTATGAISQLNSDLTDKQDKSWVSGVIGENETFIVIDAKAGGHIATIIPTIALSSSRVTYTLGSGSTTSGVAASIGISNTSVVLGRVYVNGSQVTDATYSIYGR